MSQKRKLEESIRSKLPDLIKKLKDGESSAKEDIAVLLLPYVKIVISKYRRSVDDDLESLCGFIVTRILTKVNNIDLSQSYIGYICRSAINYCLDLQKGKHLSYKKKMKSDLGLQYAVDPNTFKGDLSEVKFLIESNFCETDSEVLSMYYVDNLDLKQISLNTGQSITELKETIELAKQYI